MKLFLKKSKFLSNIFIKARDILRIIYNQKRRSRFFWNLRKGDDRLSFDYNFSSDSLVFDVGAYIGSFTEKLSNKFDCKVYCFEPKLEYFDYLSKKFKNNRNIKIFNFALSNFTGTAMISSIGAGSSMVHRQENTDLEKIKVKSIYEFLKEENIEKIDLLYLNIEGSEYNLLDEILKKNIQKKILHFQIQFHNFVDNSKIKRKTIRNILKKTHTCKFNFPFIWERWDLRIK